MILHYNFIVYILLNSKNNGYKNHTLHFGMSFPQHCQKIAILNFGKFPKSTRISIELSSYN